jgi:TorA maturation chaperone TorD
MDDARRAAIAARRSALYWLLADIVLTCPDRDFVERLQRELRAPRGEENPISIRLEEARSALPRPDDATDVGRLAVEHTRLFGGLREGYGLPPPLESMQDDGALAPEVMSAIADCYENAGLAPGERSVPPDHLGVELRYMALLCHREAEAWRADRRALALDALGRQREFVRGHLGRWTPQRWRQTAEAARHEFYRRVTTIAAEVSLETIGKSVLPGSAWVGREG